MRMSVKTVLWVSGPLALIALAVPAFVGIGIFLFIVPGLILGLAPTVFIYTAAFAVIRRLLPITQVVALNVIAGLITLGLSVAATLPVALEGQRAFDQAATGDVVPHDRVVIAGDVLVNDDETRTGSRPEVPCAALCAALLDTPSVNTVTIARADKRATYRLVPKGEAPSNGMAPKSPEQILQYVPERPDSSGRRDYQAEAAARKARESAITARWGQRLANEVTLSMVPSPQHFDLTITMTWKGSQGFHDVFVKQVEVRDREGGVLLRRQYVNAKRLVVPPLLTPVDPFSNRRWELMRTILATNNRLVGVDLITVLFEATTLAQPPT